MKFLSKLSLICNFCFLLSIVFRRLELARAEAGKNGSVIGFQPVEATVVILGYSAVLINVIFLSLFFARYPMRKMQNVPKWILFFNFILLPMQLWYFFVSKI